MSGQQHPALAPVTEGSANTRADDRSSPRGPVPDPVTGGADRGRAANTLLGEGGSPKRPVPDPVTGGADRDSAANTRPGKGSSLKRPVSGPVTGGAVNGGPDRDGSRGRGIVDPATGRVLTRLPDTDAPGVADAVARADTAFRTVWADTSPARRAGLLRELAGLLREDRDHLAALERGNAGKPTARAGAEVDFAADVVDWFAAAARYPVGETHPAAPGLRTYTDRVPVGVCAAICPNNYPLLLAVWKIAAALAYGNTVVVKPAPETPLSVRRLVESAARVLPPGVLSAVYGGAETGRLLCEHADVAMVSFTGSTAAGREVARRCGDGLKPVSLELGGKSPVVVFRDADLDAAARAVVAGFTGNTGQMCVAGTRLIVDRAVHEEFVARVAELAGALRVGPPEDPRTDLGPLISRAAADRAAEAVKEAAERGARVILPPGRREVRHGPDGGFYVHPVIVDGAPFDTRAWREELFAPVLSVAAFDTDAQALDLAHDTAYGLSASVWTGDADRAEHFGRALRAGMVWVNTWGDTEETVSVSGMGQSGYGRELGIHAVEGYTRPRAVWVAHRPGR
ncbi:aldehyde dehydrogenase family protein [Streptomyces sp. NBC_00638]|uniref:aldehyde dehydrogenase family protein n=1 Tax=unclassified Streptomyces TaxID=2593676 RepID=UPI0022513328|nr:aldehyde dehydrogenase family protein [Streptomyces sp. NBC_00638]MCX5009350.1 aldehyde dehydrogenase family protein [Streptomyces sp. NBC_00638]